MDTVPTLPVGTPLVDLHNTWGAVYIGCLFSIGLLGMTTVQAWFYYSHFPKDTRWIKLVVTAVCVDEVLRSTFTAHAAYYYLVQNWGNPAALDTVVWSLKSIITTTTIGKLFGHLFFIWRIYTLCSHSRLRYVLPAIATTLTLWDLGMAIESAVDLFRATSMTQYGAGSSRVLAPFAFATAVAVDVTITSCLVFVLSRNKTGFSRTNRLLNTLIFYAIEVGAITVLAGTSCLILTLLSNNRKVQFDYIGLYLIVGNLYANSLLATLNARDGLRSGPETVTQSLPIHFNEFSQNSNAFFRRDSATADTQAQDHRAVHLQTFFTTSVEVTEDEKPAIPASFPASHDIAQPETSYIRS